MEKEITIQGLVEEVLGRWRLVIICALLCGAIFFTYSNFFIMEQFVSKGSLYVNNKAQTIISPESQNNTANLYDLTTAEMLVDTYIEILSSNVFFELIKNNTDIEYTAEQIKKCVTYSRVEETGVIYITATAFSPKDAQKICQAVLDNANTQIMNIMEVGSVKVIDNAVLPLNSSFPNVPSNTILGVIFGMLISFAIIFFINYFDVHIKTAEEIEEKYDLVVLGTIPNMSDNTSNGGGYSE